MGSGWETAIAYLKLAMETAFETISEARLVLKIKDLVLLACSALGKSNYHCHWSQKEFLSYLALASYRTSHVKPCCLFLDGIPNCNMMTPLRMIWTRSAAPLHAITLAQAQSHVSFELPN